MKENLGAFHENEVSNDQETMKLTNKTFNDLTVIGLFDISDSGQVMLRCHCSCGADTIVDANELINHKVKNCGARIHDKRHSRLIDLTGQRFGRLTVIERSDKKSVNGNARWICQCDCGKTVDVDSQNLRMGTTRSCGCFRSEKLKKLVVHNDKFNEYKSNTDSLKDDNGVFFSSLRKSKRNHTGVIGVSFDNNSQRYVARLRYHGKYVLNKSCETLSEACQLRKAAELKYWG